MGKIIKFNANNNQNTDKNPSSQEKKLDKDDKKVEKTVKQAENQQNLPLDLEKNQEEFLKKVYEGIEEHVLSTFAVREVIDMAFVVKTNDQGEVGAIGQLAYHHKRREGLFVATFIAKGYIDKKANKVVISELAFLEGEPDYYKTIEKVLKAKKIYPEINQK
jgi:hypothetical protein